MKPPKEFKKGDCYEIKGDGWDNHEEIEILEANKNQRFFKIVGYEFDENCSTYTKWYHKQVLLDLFFQEGLYTWKKITCK
jgi:hypothetical protein